MVTRRAPPGEIAKLPPGSKLPVRAAAGTAAYETLKAQIADPDPAGSGYLLSAEREPVGDTEVAERPSARCRDHRAHLFASCHGAPALGLGVPHRGEVANKNNRLASFGSVGRMSAFGEAVGAAEGAELAQSGRLGNVRTSGEQAFARGRRTTARGQRAAPGKDREVARDRRRTAGVASKRRLHAGHYRAVAGAAVNAPPPPSAPPPSSPPPAPPPLLPSASASPRARARRRAAPGSACGSAPGRRSPPRRRRS
jgi:hypothetical protein